MDRLFQDLRFAARLLVKDRAFTLTIVATLALVLAANTAIFAVVSSVLLRPLPFPEPERILTISNQYPGAGVERASNGVPDYYDRLAGAKAFEEIAMYRPAGVTVGGQGQEAERLTSMAVTPSFFRLLRAEAHRGQLFTETEADPDQAQKVILSYGLWQRLYGGRDEAIGRDLRVNGGPFTVMGVMPQGWLFVDPDVQLWTPAAFTAAQRSDEQRHSNNWQQIGRLASGATRDQAQAQIDAINATNLERFPELKTVLINAGFRTRVAGFQEDLVAGTRRTLYLLWGGVLFVLVIGCVNVANLVSIRATSRVRELATRHALGASMRRLSRQMLTETIVLSLAGGLAGLALGRWALTAASVLGFDRLPRGTEIAIDGPVVAFMFGLIVAVGMAVGLFPMLALHRANLAQIVREEGRSGTSSRGARVVRRLLVTSQVAFALMLLIGAGLLLASFQRVLAVNPGFEPDHTLSGHIALPATRYPDAAAVRSATSRILERVRALPGVEGAGLTTTLPMSGNYSDSVIIAEGYQMAPGESLVSPNQVWVSDGYFEAMKTRLLAGRFFDARDHDEAPRVLIVDERLAKKFWPGQDPIGKHMYQPESVKNLMAPPPKDRWFTVVGVIEDVRLAGLVDSADYQRVGAYYAPLVQSSVRSASLAVRTSQAPASMTAAIRREIAAIDPELPLYGVRTMSERIEQSLVDRRTPMILAVGFASVALFLSAIGIYGVLAYQVSQRRREIGIRMALGAETSKIFRMVLGEGALIVLVGALLGLAGAFALRTTMQSQLYEIGAMDARVVLSVAGVLLGVALVACFVPARRAAQTDPVIALTESGAMSRGARQTNSELATGRTHGISRAGPLASKGFNARDTSRSVSTPGLGGRRALARVRGATRGARRPGAVAAPASHSHGAAVLSRSGARRQPRRHDRHQTRGLRDAGRFEGRSREVPQRRPGLCRVARRRDARTRGQHSVVQGPATRPVDWPGPAAGGDAQPLSPRAERDASARAWRRAAAHRLHRVALEGKSRAAVDMTGKTRARVLALSMAVTFTVMRAYLHLSPNSDLTVAGYNIHHLFTGLIFLTLGGVAAVVLPATHRFALAAVALFGVGLALALDEWLYLIVTDGTNASYLLPVSFWGGLAAVTLAVTFALFLSRQSD